MHHPTDRIAHTTAFVTPVVVFRLEVDIIRLKKEENVLFNDALNTFYIYGYMALNIWYKTTQTVREEGRKCFI